MWNFKPGMKVVCVNTSAIPPFVLPPTNIKEGETYTLTWVGPCWIAAGTEYLGVKLEGIEHDYHNDHRYKPFMAQRFRPLQSNFSSLLNEIVQGVNTGKLKVEDDKYMSKFKRKVVS